MNVRPNRPLQAKPRRDWRLSIVMVLTVVIVAMVAIGTPAVIQGSNTSRALKSSSDLSGCRSLYNATVTDARTTLDEARATSESLQDTFLAGLAGDRKGLGAVLMALGEASKQIDAAKAVEQGANDVYQNAIKLSTKDPVGFLRQCKRDFG